MGGDRGYLDFVLEAELIALPVNQITFAHLNQSQSYSLDQYLSYEREISCRHGWGFA